MPAKKKTAKKKATTRKSKPKAKHSSAPLGFEAKLWEMADKQRAHMDAAEYKHVVLGLIFLKYISDAFEEIHARLLAEQAQGDPPRKVTRPASSSLPANNQAVHQVLIDESATIGSASA